MSESAIKMRLNRGKIQLRTMFEKEAAIWTMIRKYNEFEYEKENYPKTPEHFKQFVAAQVEKELKHASIVKHRARKKYSCKSCRCRDCLCCRRHYRRICRRKTVSGKITAVFAGNRTYHYSGKFFRRRNICCFWHDRFCGTSNDCIRRKRSCYYFFWYLAGCYVRTVWSGR